MRKRKVAIIGSGNIGTDLMIKILRHGQHLEMAVMVGIDPQSDGLARARRLGVATTHEGVGGLMQMAEFADIDFVFDATSAGAHIKMGGGTGGMSLFTPMPTEGIKLLNALYREPTIENLKKMMSIFVFDTRDLTEALFEARLNNMLSRCDHLDNFVKSLEANPKQFPDFGPRLGEISAPTLIVWGRNDRFVPMDAGLRLLAGIAGSELHIYRDCGHWAQWEHADSFNQLVLNFLARA